MHLLNYFISIFLPGYQTSTSNLLIETIPSKHLLILKTSSTRPQHNNFTSSKTKICYAEDIFKTSGRHYGDQKNYLLGISVSNKSKCVSNKSIFYKSQSSNSKANPKCIN